MLRCPVTSNSLPDITYRLHLPRLKPCSPNLSEHISVSGPYHVQIRTYGMHMLSPEAWVKPDSLNMITYGATPVQHNVSCAKASNWVYKTVRNYLSIDLFLNNSILVVINNVENGVNASYSRYPCYDIYSRVTLCNKCRYLYWVAVRTLQKVLSEYSSYPIFAGCPTHGYPQSNWMDRSCPCFRRSSRKKSHY